MKKNISCFLPATVLLVFASTISCSDTRASLAQQWADMRDSHVSIIDRADQKGLLAQMLDCYRQIEQIAQAEGRESATARCRQHRLRIQIAYCASRLSEKLGTQDRRELQELAESMYHIKQMSAGKTPFENCAMIFI